MEKSKIYKILTRERGRAPFQTNPLNQRVFTDQPTFLARKASNHSLNSSPIVGKELNQEVAETDDFLTVLVSRDTRYIF